VNDHSAVLISSHVRDTSCFNLSLYVAISLFALKYFLFFHCQFVFRADVAITETMWVLGDMTRQNKGKMSEDA